MSKQAQSSSFADRVVQVQARLADRLRTFRPDMRTYATAFCVGATIGEYAATAGSADPAAVLVGCSPNCARN
jgi:uncharacterized metal-binding protein